MSVVLRRRPCAPVPGATGPPADRATAEKDFYRRARSWLCTSVATWSIWAVTGAPTGFPHGSGGHHHLVITMGIWPAYLTVLGLIDLAKRAHRVYVEGGEADTEAER